MVVFRETLRRHWRQMLYWGLGFLAYGWMTTMLVPDMEALQNYVSIVNSMPSGLLQAFGISDAAVIATPSGFVAFGYFIYIVLVLAVYAVIVGLSITASDEDSGIMDMVLALPLPRWRVIVEKFAAYSIALIVIVLMGHAGLLLGIFPNPNAASLDTSRLLEVSLNMIPSGLLIMAITVVLGTLVRRRSTAAALAGVFVIVSYVLDVLGASVQSDLGDMLRSVSFLRYYDSMGVLKDGLPVVAFVGVTLVALVLTAGSVVLFQRRDISV